MNYLVTLILTLYTSLVFAQTSIEQVIKEAKKPSLMEENLRFLSDEIGGRLPGTPALKRAVDWSVNAFKIAGADKVLVDPFTIQVSWQEGKTDIEVVSPEPFKLKAASFGWSPALITKTPARVMDLGNGSAKEFSQAGDISGAVILIHTKLMSSWEDLFAEYSDLYPVVDRALAGKALAIAVMSSRPLDLLYRHMNVGPNKIEALPIFLLAREDAQRIERLLEKKKELTLNINMPNKIGPAFTAWNVSAEIKGSEKPDEWVLLGAHLDSLDLGTGALDNGCNVALVIDAYRAIKDSGVKPKRSIRFALFSGEEQGFIGSQAYVLAHHSEMKNSAGVVIIDGGSGAITGYSLSGRKDFLANSEKVLAPLRQLGIRKSTLDADVGTDNISFLLEGIPNLVANQDKANYLVNYHAQSDTFDKVDLKQLRKNLMIATGTLLALADAPKPVGKILSVNELEALLKKTGLDTQMKSAGVWSYWTEIKTKR